MAKQREEVIMDPHTLKAQMSVVFAAFSKPKTMLQVEIETGIMRSNITRYVATWERSGKIKRLGTGLCPISKHKSGFYVKKI